jgi:hypothetical protein
MQVSRRGLFVSSAAVLAGTALGGCAARSAGPAKDSASSAGADPDLSRSETRSRGVSWGFAAGSGCTARKLD